MIYVELAFTVWFVLLWWNYLWHLILRKYFFYQQLIMRYT